MHDPLSQLERRVLGVLVEKALTAASPEPLTLNAVVIGSNQKSNRDPLMSVEEPEADSALESLQRKGLVFRITGGRVERWRHNLYDAWNLSKPEVAILTELLLRGPQTAAEARSRASRMEPLDHETASAAIKSLADRGYIVWLMPESRRGALLTHGLHFPDELQRLRSGHGATSVAEETKSPAPPPPSGRSDAVDPPIAILTAELAAVREEIKDLRAMVVRLQEELGLKPPVNPSN